MNPELSPAAAELILAVWLLATGAAVGSFLNVVVYRLPLGKSLVRPGSHCPACKHPIRWRDNVPVFSWFFLRGRCRDCAARFSFRYPAVEAITAVLFVLVGAIEGFSGGANLPLQKITTVDGALLPPFGQGQSAAIVAFHLLLLCTLLAAALIEYDGHRLPVRLFMPALVVGWLAPIVWPYLHPASAWHGPDGLATSLIDGGTAFCVGLLLGLMSRRRFGVEKGVGLLWGPACVGLFLGWTAVIVLTLAAITLCWPVSSLKQFPAGLRRVSPIGWLAFLALGWILAWGWLIARWPVLGLVG